MDLETLRARIGEAVALVRADLEATRAPSVSFAVGDPDPRDHDPSEWVECRMYLEEDPPWGPVRWWSRSEEPSIARVACDVAFLVQDLIAESGRWWGRGWPECPDHPGPPLLTAVVGDEARWRCPKGDLDVRIGSLEGPVEDPTSA